LPVRVTGTLVPRKPEPGLTVFSVGASTVNTKALLVPLAVVTVTFLAPVFAFVVIVNVAVTCVELTT
jgi:hypothetical protein